VRYDASDAKSVRQQLQRHFDVVLALLIAATPNSLETAVQRLERSSSSQWSDAERNRVAQELLLRRYVQLTRLRAYRDRGLFPLNNGQAGAPTPVFVDGNDTACAVGHLIRMSGRRSEVAAIARANNLVYISDETQGPLAQWVLESGLTIEEAALIQPTYPNFPTVLPPIPADAVRPLEAGWSGVINDLQFSNFRFYRRGAAAPSVNAAVTHSFCNAYGCSILPRIEDYNGHLEHTGWFQLLPEGFDDFERVVVQFDVETLLPSQRIASKPQGSTPYTRSQQLLGQRNDVLLFAVNTEDEVLMAPVVHWEYVTPIILSPSKVSIIGPIDMESWQRPEVFNQTDFQPTRRMNVVTELLLRNGQQYQAQLLHFDVVQVPEPDVIILLIGSLAAIGARIRCRNTPLLVAADSRVLGMSKGRAASP
jgi:hypothetical protein